MRAQEPVLSDTYTAQSSGSLWSSPPVLIQSRSKGHEQDGYKINRDAKHESQLSGQKRQRLNLRPLGYHDPFFTQIWGILMES